VQNSLFFHPPENEADRFSQNFNLQASKTGGEIISLQKFVSLNIADVKSGIKNYQQIGLKNITVKGIRWAELIYTGNLEDNPMKIRFVQRFAINQEMLMYLPIVPKQINQINYIRLR
jgi:outer membrane PBP1 activator LpoA protein